MTAAPVPTSDVVASLTAHTWSPQPETASFIHRLLNACLHDCQFAQRLSQRMLDEAGTRMLDWIDHFGMDLTEPLRAELRRVGYTETTANDGNSVWSHSAGMFPRIIHVTGRARRLAIKVESVTDFLVAHNLSDVEIQGAPFAPLRTARVSHGENTQLWIVERHGYAGFDAAAPCNSLGNCDLETLARHSEALRLRRRACSTDAAGFAQANLLIDAAIADLGRDRACDLFFAAEREYWQHRNRAGRIQLARQETLGLGWANHDHHTYRSSRASFVPLIAFLEKLGFVCRERFYAGREAGWGAQVIEQPITGVTIFADVDLSPEELAQDFSHDPLPPRDELGTVGLWCALHGEAFLEAGMHHLECQFDFAATRDQLKEIGIDTMPPFTDLPYLRQAFTRGEQWAVNPVRVERLRAASKITNDQARQFLEHGALGSHMEILQRDDGYKGFNQRGINEIIAATDPRRATNN